MHVEANRSIVNNALPAAGKFWLPLAASLAVLAAAYGPMLVAFFQNQWEHPQYQYFPFVLGAFAWLLWRGCAQSVPRQPTEHASRRAGMLLLVAAAWGLLALAYLADSPWLAIVSAILLVASRFVSVSGAWRIEYLWGIWAMLLLLVPLPLNRDQALINRLQHLSSRVSSFFLDLVGVHHLMDGNALRLPEKEFFVDEACSGIVSVMSVIACAVIYGVWRNRPPMHVILLAAAGVVWATLMNVGRITTIAVAYAWWGVDWSSGSPHEILGLAVFTITFLALVSTDYLLVAVLAPIRSGEDAVGTPIRYGARLAAWWDALGSWGAPRPENVVAAEAARVRSRRELWTRFALGLIPLLAFGTLAAGQFAVPRLVGLAHRPLPPHRIERALEMSETSLPETIGTLQRVGFEAQERERGDIFGQYSRLYRYQDPEGTLYLVSCDFPFGPVWHDLRVCYEGTGWTEAATSTVPSTGPGANEWGYINVDFGKPDGNAGRLTYCAFDEYGDRLAPPTGQLFDDFWRSLEKQYRAKTPARYFQIQVWTTGPGTVSEKQAATARELLLAAREQFHRFITRSEETPSRDAR